MTRPPHRPPNPHTAAGVALVAAGLTPEAAAEQLREQGHQISGKTIRRAMANGAAPPRPEAAREEQPPGRLPTATGVNALQNGQMPRKQGYSGDAVAATAAHLSPGARRNSRVSAAGSTRPTGTGGDEIPGSTGGDPRASGPGPSLPPAKLADLRDLIGRLPFAQQDHLVATLPLERLRREAIARGIAPYHEAASAVASELRRISL